MKFSIYELHLIIESLATYNGTIPNEIEYQRIKKKTIENIITMCRKQVLDIEGMKFD